MSVNSVSFSVGTEGQLDPLFAYRPKGVTLADGIAHSINQTLLRDLFDGAWAQVWVDKVSGSYQVKITSPATAADITRYATQIPAFIEAVGAAYAIYQAHASTLPSDVRFLPPFGLAMLRTKSIQLLHYPPLETLDYIDYLYSPTNRRWENLLACCGYPGAENTLVETIVDAVPIGADGGAAGAAAIASLNNSFTDYHTRMLNVIVVPSPSGKSTQPIVAYGGPVLEFLETNFGQSHLQVLSLISLQLLRNGPPTPVLCANHPSRFFYYKPGQEDAFRTILKQDLIAAGWQAEMARDPDADPVQALSAITAYWTAHTTALQEIFDQQVTEFEYV